MTDDELWRNAPTVYGVIVEGATIPIIDAMRKVDGFPGALEHRYHLARSTSRTMRLIDIGFMPALGPSRGLDASTTRMMIELREDYDVTMRLLLWNGHRIDIIRHLSDIERCTIRGIPLPYSMGLLKAEEAEWTWRRGLSRGQLFAATRFDDETIASLGSRSPRNPIDERKKGR